MPAILDSGAMEVCLIPRRIAEDTIRNSNTNVETLDPPFKLQLGHNKTEVLSMETIAAIIRLRTKVSELITCRQQYLIWEVPSDEIILGGDFLSSWELIQNQPWIRLL